MVEEKPPFSIPLTCSLQATSVPGKHRVPKGVGKDEGTRARDAHCSSSAVHQEISMGRDREAGVSYGH